MFQHHPPYNPFTPPGHTPSADPPTAISAGQKRWAKLAGASHIAADGYYCYRWEGGKVQSKQWYSDRYSMNWMDTGKAEMPPDVVKVE